MTVSNLKTQYKSILKLFIICNVINIPVLLYRKQIADYFASHTSINTEDEKRALFNWLNYITLFIAVLVNIPMMTKLNNIILFWVYILAFVFFAMINPIGIFTDTLWSRIAVICSLPFIFALLKSFDLKNDFNTWLYTGFVCMLTLFNRNMIYTFYTTLSTYPEFIMYTIFYILGYIIIMRPAQIDIKRVVDYVKNRELPKINTILVIELFILFLFVYIRSFTKNYYGGKLIVANPISLQKSNGYNLQDKMYEYTISSWFNLNAHGPNYNASSSEFTSILWYANSVMVSYQTNTNTLRVTIKNKTEKHHYNMHPKLQTWNHLVLMYSNGVFDIFINGELKNTFTIVPDISNHQLNIGTNKGVLGRMCSITYYQSSISDKLIKSIYEALKDKDPPTF